MPGSQSKACLFPPELSAGLEHMSSQQGGSLSPGVNITSRAGMCNSSVSSHAEMSQDDPPGNPMPCPSAAHTERVAPAI